MASIHIDCDIRSSNSKLVFQTIGTLNNHVMTFQDPSQDTHILTMKDNTVIYEKTGASKMTFHFDTSRVTSGTYQVLGQTLIFDIKTTKLHHEPGIIRLQYDLIQDNEPVGQTSLAIDYRNKEE